MQYRPRFRLSSSLLSLVSAVDRLYGQLEGMRIPRKLLLNLERGNLYTSTYVSNSIEGNPLSLPEVTNLLLDARVPVNRDEREIRNYFDILKSFPDRAQEKMDLDLVLSIHRDLLKTVDDSIAGKIRHQRVVVGRRDAAGRIHVRHEPPTHDRQEIARRLSSLLSWFETSDLHPVLKGGIFHHEFVHLHPFGDGNGRTCRLLTALALLKGGYLINRYFVLDDAYDVDRALYADKLQSADRGEKSAWLAYFVEGMVFSLRSAKARIAGELRKLEVTERPTPRERDVLMLFQKHPQLTTPEIVRSLGVSRQQAHVLLQGLLAKGFLEKRGTTKGSYYVLV